MRRLKHRSPLAWAAALWALAAPPAGAVCQVDTSTLAFGMVDVARGVDSTADIVVACDVATGFEVAVIGNGVPGARYLAGPGSARLAYDVYPDATRSVPWSDGGGSGARVGASNDGNGQTALVVYGRVPIQGAVPPGVYLDALTVAVTF